MESSQYDDNDNDDHQEGGKKELKLINSGAFGCIFKPEYTCLGNIGSSKYITKIQKNKRTIANELRISEKVRSIRGYVRFFAPVLKYCNVKIKKDRIKDMKKCEIFEDESDKKIEQSTYISMKMRYVGKTDLRKHIFLNVNTSAFFREILKTHTHLLKATQKLIAHKIVHFDLKYNNVMFDAERKSPIMIDFGQSWAIDELKTDSQISTAFFVFDQYDYWCIDILICNYITQEVGLSKSKTAFVTDVEMKYIFDVFIYGLKPEYDEKNNKKTLNDAFKYNILQNPQKMAYFETTFNEYSNRFVGTKTWWELYSDLIIRADTWDCYSIAIIYLNMLDDVFISSSELYNSLLFVSGTKMAKYVEMMEQIVYSAPNGRPSVATVLSEIESIARSRS
jgi:serine/threonine protein kinase